MRNKYVLKRMSLDFNAKEETIGRAIKLIWSKKLKADPADILAQHWGIVVKSCAFCGERSNRYNINVVVNGNEVDISGISFDTAAPSGDNFYCYGRNEQCPGKQMNPNSVEFVSAIHGVSKDDALEIIHSRNNSPFYERNHKSRDDYGKAQSRNMQWFLDNEKDRDAWIERANYSRSLEGLTDKYGEAAIGKLRDINARKANSLENYITRYGEILGLERYRKKCADSAHSIEQCIRRYGVVKGELAFINTISSTATYRDLVDFSVSVLKKEPSSVVSGFPAAKHLLAKRTVEIGLRVFGKNIDELIEDCKQSDCALLKYQSIKTTGRYGSYLSYTEDGQLLRSSKEIKFYSTIRCLYPDWVILSNGTYPGSKKRYDFYFPKIDTYIEIAGLMFDAVYRSVIEEKITKHNCLVLDDRRCADYDRVIEELKDRHDRIGR